jgi:hypothetical protein
MHMRSRSTPASIPVPHPLINTNVQEVSPVTTMPLEPWLFHPPIPLYTLLPLNVPRRISPPSNEERATPKSKTPSCLFSQLLLSASVPTSQLPLSVPVSPKVPPHSQPLPYVLEKCRDCSKIPSHSSYYTCTLCKFQNCSCCRRRRAPRTESGKKRLCSHCEERTRRSRFKVSRRKPLDVSPHQRQCTECANLLSLPEFNTNGKGELLKACKVCAGNRARRRLVRL